MLHAVLLVATSSSSRVLGTASEQKCTPRKCAQCLTENGVVFVLIATPTPAATIPTDARTHAARTIRARQYI